MPHIPAAVLKRQPPLTGLRLKGRGKVRDSYHLDSERHLLVVASDRISIFDFVLNATIPYKGEVLTALNHFWVTEVLRGLFRTDLVTCGKGVVDFLPLELRKNPDVQKRSTVVERHCSPEIEDIVRIILTGSGLKSYRETGRVCGHKLPPGLIDGSMLPFPIYTPTTKAKEGHDEHLHVDAVIEKYGFKRERIALQVIQMMAAYAKKRGILLGDGKLEIYNDVLIDEKGTPDSCRYMDLLMYERMMAEGKLAPSLDKQYVRNEGKKFGIDKLEPTNPKHLAMVDETVFPDEVIHKTSAIYRYIFWRLTGLTLEQYQREKLGIDVADLGPESGMPREEDFKLAA